MTDIFISHAVADKALADKFVSFLKEAIGVPAKSIFCSSVNGQGIPLGDDFNEYMKKQIQKPRLVILLMTPAYMESWFCLMELGATWAKSLKHLPIVVPPIKFNVISSTLGLRQGWSIDDDTKLIDLRQTIKSLGISLEDRTEHDWEKKRIAWKADLKKLLKQLAAATKISAQDHKSVQEELALVKSELALLEESYGEATSLIEELKATKDKAAVKAVILKKKGFNAEDRFDELIQTISNLKPKVSTNFYRNMILNLYGKSIAVNWYDHDQRTDAESAIQYNMMDRDAPHDYLWKNKKMKAIAVAVDELEDFLASEEASDFVKELESNGRSMDITDLEFWEENLA